MTEDNMQGTHRVNQTFHGAIVVSVFASGLLSVLDGWVFGQTVLSGFVAANLGLGLLVGLAVAVAMGLFQRVEGRFAGLWQKASWKAALVWTGIYLGMVAGLSRLMWMWLAQQTKFVNDLSVPMAMVVSLGLVVLAQALVRLRFKTWGMPALWVFALAALGSVATTLVIVQPYRPDFLAVFAVFNLFLASVTLVRSHVFERFVRPVVTVGSLGLAMAGTFWGALTVEMDRPAAATVMAEGVFNRGSLRFLQGMSDLDGDGTSHLFGDGDCNPWDAAVYPLRDEIVGNGVDDNCGGGDLALWEPREATAKVGQIKPRHVFLFTIDTLRADVVEMVVGGVPVAQNLSRFAAESVNYTRGYSPSTYTNEAMPSMMSGELPQRWHSARIYMGQEPTLAQHLYRAGYQTEAVIAFPWLHDGAILGFDYVDNELGLPEIHGGERGQEVLKRMFSRIDQRRTEQPYFGWLHLLEPHTPYTGSEVVGHFGDDLRGKYLQDVYQADQVFGQFVAGLKARGLWDEAVVVVAADHGEGLGEHGVATHLWGAWESVIRVPLMVKIPGVAAQRVAEPVSTLDILPTVLHALGQEAGGVRDGRVMPPWGQGGDVHVTVDDQKIGPILRVMVRGDHKVLWDVKANAWLLFDVVKDPMEESPIDDPQKLAEMREALFLKWDQTFNDRAIQRKAELWETRELYFPREYKGDVGNMIELKARP